MRLWDGATGAPISEPLRAQGGEVTKVAFSSDETRMICESRDNALRLLDIASGAPIGAPLLLNSTLLLSGVQLYEHGRAVSSVAFSGDGKRFVSGNGFGMLQLWDTETRTKVGEPLPGDGISVRSVALSPDGTRIVRSGDDNTLRLWDAETRTQISEPRLPGEEGSAHSVAFSPDGRRIVSISDDGIQRNWDGATGSPIGPPLADSPLPKPESEVFNRSDTALSPDGTREVVGTAWRSLQFWDVRTAELISEYLHAHESGVSSVAISPDGTRIVSGDYEGALRMWRNWPTGNLLQLACRFLPVIDGHPDNSTEGLADEIGIEGLVLPKDCDSYDPPIPPLQEGN